jgi:type IV pilus assembly protein PilE
MVNIKKIKKGFTIIEILVVIGIIAVLTVVIFPSINNIRAKNKDSEKVSDISAIRLALSLYYNQNPTTGYPATLDQLKPKYLSVDSLTSPDSEQYVYVPLQKGSAPNTKCTYYHLGVKLAFSKSEIDANDLVISVSSTTPFSSARYLRIGNGGEGYDYCGTAPANWGIDGTNPMMYSVHP